jgi:hypothetical protein
VSEGLKGERRGGVEVELFAIGAALEVISVDSMRVYLCRAEETGPL